ncbi:MAG: Gfo/Idh/MocA family oxidoreductase [Armatimonadetes bacterium]|nr:Gfo/Idh/MocA family oxidoreductase [Armatimonadota bacterium]
MTRRELVHRAVGLSGAFMLPAIVPASALGRDGAVAPSERIALGAIGIGPRGRDVLNYLVAESDVQFVAICDVRADRRQSVKEMADAKYGNKDCAMYRDLRELLARPDIDAVLIATGDRWHALGSIMAAKAGKDVYSEKPCSLTIGQCQALSDTIRRYGRVFQAGTQRRSVPNFEAAVKLAQSGKLGKIRTLHASINELFVRHDWLPAEPEPPKDTVDWDMWLGPAPWRPYHHDYVNGGWRGHWDFDSGGRLLDWGAHTLDICQWANQSDDTVPIEYEAEGGSVHATYASGVKLVLRTGGWMGLGTCPVRFEGDEGWVETGDSGRIEVEPKSLQGELAEVRRIAGTNPGNHGRNFLDCVKSGGRPNANADVMRRSHIACYAASFAWMLGRKLRFDPVAERFIGDDEANNLRDRAMREPWRI